MKFRSWRDVLAFLIGSGFVGYGVGNVFVTFGIVLIGAAIFEPPEENLK